MSAAAEKAARATTSFNDGPRDGKHANLRDSIEHTLQPGLRAKVRATAPHAVFIERGTKEHTIAARRGPFLHFKVAGRWVKRRSVHHPGNSARWFMRDAGTLLRPTFHANLENATTTAIRRHNG